MASGPPQGHSFLKPKMQRGNDVNNKPKRKSTMESVEYTILPSIDRDQDYISTDKDQHSESNKKDRKEIEENIEYKDCKEKDTKDNDHKKENVEDTENSDIKRRLVHYFGQY